MTSVKASYRVADHWRHDNVTVRSNNMTVSAAVVVMCCCKMFAGAYTSANVNITTRCLQACSLGGMLL